MTSIISAVERAVSAIVFGACYAALFAFILLS